ncbi:MAG: lipoprotein signal peptidase [Porticoccaceae bacterium]|nr:MAG: lipoprotein signal peptidase [Porticoccaceae bacterium]
MARRLLPWLAAAGLVALLDQLTKLWALAALAPHRPVAVLPFLSWTLVFNPGAAFSFLAGAGGWQRWLLAGAALAIAAALLVWLARLPARGQRLEKTALALVLGGALGNLIDRLARGHVVDFVDLHWGSWHFPAFNLADSAITLGAFLLLWRAFIPGR